MGKEMTRLYLWVAGILFILGLAGCAPVPSSEAADGYTARIIVKFSDMSANPADRNFVENLSHDVGVSLGYLRPMSGGAHVFEVRNLRDAAELQEVLRRLSKRPGVAYAEQDSLRRKQ